MKKALKSIARRFGYEITGIPPPGNYAVISRSTDREYDPFSLKAFANRAAEFAPSVEQAKAIRSLYLTGLLKQQTLPETTRIEVGNAKTLELGIWRKENQAKDAPFVRRPDSDWFNWADNETIQPKRGTWRVVLLGESVARGYLYDPEFTPASALEGMLRRHLGATEIDVIDLAASSLKMQALRNLIGQSLALSPDVIVVFAGNNWHLHLSESDIPQVYGLLREEGVPAVKSYLDAKVQEDVTQLTAEVNSILNGKAVKIIWIVPEFNLDDWRDPVSNAPLLVGQGNKQWRDLDARASLAFAQGDLTQVRESANKMVELDGGTNSIPLRMLAEVCRSKGDLQGTRRYLERCRDAEGWNPFFAYSPRTSSTIQTCLRQAASAENNTVIDLPDVFARHFGNALPNRRIFLDYCHLTTDGITVAMAAVASEILRSLAGNEISIDNLRQQSAAPSAQVEGKASLLAAIHNAHYYQDYEVAHYWCARAVQLWPACSDVMIRFLDFQTRDAPLMACKSAMELFGRRELTTLMRGGKKRLDLVLSRAMIDSLSAIDVDLGKQISDLRVREHSITTGAKELTDFYYSSAMLGPAERAWTSKSFSSNRGSRTIYSSAFWQTSKFVFLAEKGLPLGLKFTYRVPNLLRTDSTVRIDVNGSRVAEVPATVAWKTVELHISDDCLIDGVNEIVITWPDEEGSSEVALNCAAETLIASWLPQLYRVFGEIHALLVFDVSDRQRNISEAHSADLGRAPRSSQMREAVGSASGRGAD